MFTLIESAIGAFLIHLATSSYLAECGRTVGFSSVLYQSVFSQAPNSVSIASGLVASSLICYLFIPEFLPPALSVSTSIFKIGVAGALVGWGSSWGSGCTSGHMLCGLSLLRKRSFVATVVFCSSAMVIANLYSAYYLPECVGAPCYTVSFDLLAATKYRLIPLVLAAIVFNKGVMRSAFYSGFKTGLVFGLGLFISGMANPEKPLRFLSILHPSKFDPSLFMIILFAIVPNIIKWSNITSRDEPIVESKFSLPTSSHTPPKFLLGNVIFGLGWGLLGVCPGPGLINAVFSFGGVAWLVSFLVASFVARRK